ncbi:DEAD/DEAH box helicase family protein [Photobacterium sp. TY1-4]|uniref:DEAD/DEAH box helicase family protein n=1 Tax=Photobacterium sp. TY1-4 TaxID=2899122 RepID=UPI0021C098CA|nr:DEAD/DEAH box helicase family protein [Photobacterium sp. TY1-4]UXI04711.1 DEAD/DEAH box helicase family protein [Photobacterium sp. TY1-4]
MTEGFKEARQELVTYMRNQLIGPIGGDKEELKDAPHKRYLMGTLFPPAACVDETDESQGEDSTTEALSNDFKPSSMAMSFAVKADTVLALQVSAGQYQKKGQAAEWQRAPLKHPEEIRVSESSKKEIFGGKARLDISVRPYAGGKVVTIALSNKEDSGDRLDPAKCLYQCALSVTVIAGCIKEYPSSDRFKLDDEQKDLDLAYRKRVPWAVGHGVAVDWDLDQNAVPTTIRTESMPTHEVKDFSTDIDAAKYPELDTEILSITRIADPGSASQEELLAGYDQLITTYSRWIDELEAEPLAHRYHAAQERTIGRLRKAAGRMRKGIGLLRRNKAAMNAFRLANKAMLMQMIHTGDELAGELKDRDWGYTTPDYFSKDIVKNYQWRPFQLAYQLLVLESMIPDPETNQLSSSHDDVDLLWFPTGGGKTEAYLAVAAWEMIYRRLTKGRKGGGTAVIKRYTLRLLTSQQFQRAGSLICALEILRKGDAKLGEESFTLGLWAGQASTPNDFKSAHEKFTVARQDQKPESSFQLQSCPWCGTRILPREYDEDNTAYGIRCNSDSRFEFFCPSQKCDFHHQLPIQVVDQALYAAPPTLLIGTIDKFARMTWKAEAASFFGDGKVLPPSLIIQDEMHLISGPLGTIAGIYEAGFDTIMEVLGAKPKVIAATATIRAAQQQSTRLFGRNVNVFPPAGTDEADSFFSKEEKSKPGRLYVGIMPSGHTGQTSLVQSCAAALQAPFELAFKSDTLDSYWTLPVYHNSRRELGKTMTLARDDIPERIKVIASEPRNIQWVEELSAGIKGSKIPEVLKDLGLAAPAAIDVLPCTNMISVGVDIGRLGMMIIAGQPKATAEYIQASSRVGRSKKRPPGIVITQYSPTKPRDRSHYETFKSYHQALYRHVEPTSVTPWALPALERALHAALIAAVRVTGYLRINESAKHFSAYNPQFQTIYGILVSRINAAMAGMPQNEQEGALQYLQSLIDTWEERAHRRQGSVTQYESINAGPQFPPLIQPFESNSHNEAWKTLNSMRNVDTETNLYIRGEV